MVVTNDSSEESGPFALDVGLIPYKDVLRGLNPDHYWALDGDYDDTGITGPVRNMTSGVVNGGGVFNTNVISENTTNTWAMDNVITRREIADSPNMNITISSKERSLGFWLQLNGVQKSLATVWKEGGGVQNLAVITGLGNVLMFQLADVAGTRDNVQAVSGFRLKPGRPYHIAAYYTHNATVKEARLIIDGRLQPAELTDGNPMTLGIFDSHSGDVTWCDADNNLETGGTDIAYAGQEDTYMNHFYTLSDNSAGGGLLSLDDVLNKAFRRGAIPDDIISSDTESNMQTAIDSTSDTRQDWPLSYRIEAPTGQTDLELTLIDKDFDQGISDHLEWRGSGTLTIISVGATNIDQLKTFSPTGGTVVVLRRTLITLNNLPSDTEVRIYENIGSGIAGAEIAGQEAVNTGTFSFSSDTGTEVIITIFREGQDPIRDLFTVPSGDIQLPISIRDDRWYLNPA